MVKYVQCIRRRAGLTVPEFRTRWTAYAENIRRIAPGLGAKRVSLSTMLAVGDNVRIQTQRGTADPFDGMVEVYFQSGAKTIETILSSPANLAAMEEMVRALSEFADIPGSAFFWAQDDD